MNDNVLYHLLPGLGISAGFGFIRPVCRFSALVDWDREMCPNGDGFTLARLWGLVQGSPVEHHTRSTRCGWVKHQSESESLFTSQ
jgi:hypothetical protein